ncbi:MAG: hypothetical protein ACYCZO_00965 [Daejeonella sp.]
MSKDEIQAGSKLNHISKKGDPSTSTKDMDKLIEVRKKDNAEDKDNRFILHENPFDEQMYDSFDDLREGQKDEEGD